MEYVRRLTNTWNSINPATLSGAIDVIVIEDAEKNLSCSPFHVRFGKFSLLRPSEKKVLFKVNGDAVDFKMKLGEGGEAFFVFETESEVPKEWQTSPVLSAIGSPTQSQKDADEEAANMSEPDEFDLDNNSATPPATASPDPIRQRPTSGDWSGSSPATSPSSATRPERSKTISNGQIPQRPHLAARPSSQVSIERARQLRERLSKKNILSEVTKTGDVMLDMHGYKASLSDSIEAEREVRRILEDELKGEGGTEVDIESLVGADREGNLWIYASEEAKEDAEQRKYPRSESDEQTSDDAISIGRARSEGLSTPPPLSPPRSRDTSPSPNPKDGQHRSNYAKTLRLTSEQLRSLNLKPGMNPISFTVVSSYKGNATCNANIFYWSCNVPVVISDIDGTITKSDALGHIFTMVGRDWTHPGVAKLYTDIAKNGYNILYLTSRSVGQADATRAYLKSIEQTGIKMPDGPVIMSPDRTMAALKREMILKKPEVFKMACLKDIRHLYGEGSNPFYAGYGNRITDALSYRSVGIPSSRIFTINSTGEVRMELLELAGYRSSYISINDLVDHFFPPVVAALQAEYTDVNFWREPIPDLPLSDEEESEEEDDGDDEGSYDEGGEGDESYEADDDLQLKAQALTL
ncbi:lipin Ned1 [Saitoella coloradoensis]